MKSTLVRVYNRNFTVHISMILIHSTYSDTDVKGDFVICSYLMLLTYDLGTAFNRSSWSEKTMATLCVTEIFNFLLHIVWLYVVFSLQNDLLRHMYLSEKEQKKDRKQ